MTDHGVTPLLKQLHATLESKQALNETDRALLKQLSSDIELLLAEPGAATGASRQGLIDRLKTEVTRFEVSHPDLTAALSHVSKALADMGI